VTPTAKNSTAIMAPGCSWHRTAGVHATFPKAIDRVRETTGQLDCAQEEDPRRGHIGHSLYGATPLMWPGLLRNGVHPAASVSGSSCARTKPRSTAELRRWG
jgi:hypothetical protein